ncbi:MAG: hypothetical protein NTX50_14250, partial [Candidatus Sumerlaeota bacterium]|nr:hypothetical protein [Candidatus Sumerlaeota bacterium]
QGATLAAGMAAIAFSVMLLTTFAAYTITAQLAFAGVVAILNSQSDTRPVFQRQFSRRGAGAANAGIVLGMLGYALLACLTIWGDHQFRKVEYQLSDVQMQRQWLKVAGAQPEATLAPFKQRLADSEKNVRERIQYLLQRVMPRMRIAAYVEHYYCMAFGRYCLESGENDSARVFFQKALSLHPNDRQCLAYLSDIFIREGQPAMAIPYLEKGARVFGCNPYQPFARNLAWVYQQQGKPAEAALLLAKAENNKVACPVKPSPADGARNVPAAVTLAWEACRSAESYDVYVFPVGQTMPEMPSLSGLKKSEARLSLQPGVTYIWRVVATGPYDEQSGALWTFQTAPQIP